jgi:hypothetical protein
MSGYGTDLYCYDRILTGRFATGLEALAQAIYRRLTTPRGTLDDGEEGTVYGLDVLDFTGTVGSDAAVDALPDVVRAEVLKDDRVERCEISATIERGTDGLVVILLDVDVFPADESTPFQLSISVSDVTIALLGVTPI